GKDHAGVEESQWIKGLLHGPETSDRFGTQEVPEHTRTEPPGTVLPRRCSAQLDQACGDAVLHVPDAIQPARLAGIGQQVHVDVAIARVSEHHRIDSGSGTGLVDRLEIAAQLVEGYTAILDHLQRA